MVLIRNDNSSTSLARQRKKISTSPHLASHRLSLLHYNTYISLFQVKFTLDKFEMSSRQAHALRSLLIRELVFVEGFEYRLRGVTCASVPKQSKCNTILGENILNILSNYVIIYMRNKPNT